MQLLEEGSHVPADGRLLSVVKLAVGGSALTGESILVRRSSASVAADAPLV